MRKRHSSCAQTRGGMAVACVGPMLKILGWIVLVIFLIGLLVVIGVFDFLF